MPISRRNKWTDNLAEIEAAQVNTAASIDQVVAAQDRTTNSIDRAAAVQGRTADSIDQLAKTLLDPTFLAANQAAITAAMDHAAEEASQKLEGIGDRIKDTADAVVGASERIAHVAAEVARTARAVETISERHVEGGVKDMDLCTALYAAAVDVSGHFVARTDAGKLLRSVATSLADLSTKDRDSFVAEIKTLLKNGADGGVINHMREEELGRFYDRASAVMKAIEWSQRA
jgi:hypothetical protein